MQRNAYLYFQFILTFVPHVLDYKNQGFVKILTNLRSFR